jgi:transcriptional regulator with XRE-family HTH domain
MIEEGDIMYEEEFPARLAKLRAKKGVSSQEMSLSIGQNTGYISNIECGKALPSMSAFFFICDYLNITPSDFFDEESGNPEKIRQLVQDLKQLDEEQLSLISSMVKNLLRSK